MNNSVDVRLNNIDREAVQEISRLSDVDFDVALKTYQFGMLLRAMMIEEIEKSGKTNSKLFSILKNESLARFALLILVPSVRLLYSPLLRLANKTGRKL